MTEDEAKQRWCPMVRNVEMLPDGSQQIYLANGPSNKCIGSACMMWRVHGWMNKEEAIPVNASTQWEYPVHKLKPSGDAELHGYCGLAGKP